MHEQLALVVRSTSRSSTTSTTTCATSPTTTTRTPDRGAASSATAMRRAALSDLERDRVHPHDRPRHVGAEGRALHPRRRVRRRRVQPGRAACCRPAAACEQRPADWWAGIVARDRRLLARTTVRAVDDIVAVVGDVAVVGHGAGRRATAHRCTTRSSGWTRAARGRSATLVGGRGEGAGLRAAQAAHVDQAHRRRAGALGQGPDRAHPLAPGASGPTSPAATCKYLEPKDWLNLKLTGGPWRPTTRSSCTGSPTTATSRDRVRPELLAHRRDRPGAAARPRRRDRRRRPAAPRRRGRARRCPPASRWSAARPTSSRPRSAPGAVADFEGHLYVGTSSWLTCHVPFKKTDILRGSRRCRRRCRASTTSPTSRRRPARCLNWLRDTCSSPTTSSAPAAARRRLRRIDALAATRRRRAATA